MRLLPRKLRSVSVRSGIVAASVVGLVMVIGLLLIIQLIVTSFIVTATGFQVAQVDAARDELLAGTAPSRLDIASSSGDPSGSFWIVLEDGVEVASGGAVVADAFSTPFQERAISVEFADATDRATGFKTFDGNDWFVIEDVIVTDEAEYRLLAADSNESSFGSSASDFVPFLIPVVLLVMIVTAVITGLSTRFALKTVDNMREEVEQITRESLDRRVSNTGARDVIDKLANTMNGMLGRLESSTMQQSQFLADASHELRSPVAGVLAQLEVAAMYPDRVDTNALIPKLKAEAERLQLLVDDLLFLSRSESRLTHRPPPSTAAVSIDAMFEAELDIQRILRPEIEICAVGATGVVVAGIERDLGRVLRNLTNNAVRHASSRVELGVSVVGEMAAVTVRDDGAGIAPDDAARIFERFVRLDEGRARDHGGSGLGLAIVYEVVRQHGGGISLIDQERGGATFQVLLPLAAVAATV